MSSSNEPTYFSGHFREKVYDTLGLHFLTREDQAIDEIRRLVKQDKELKADPASEESTSESRLASR